jgi:type III pantothenate kinase
MNANRKRWLIDLGNSRLKCAALDAQGQRGEVLAISHGQPNPMTALLDHFGSAGAGAEAWLASVASVERTMTVIENLQEAGLQVRRIHTQARCGKLHIAYPEPARLGVDRFLAMLAACDRDDGPWLIVSAGSALTVDLLGADGGHVGGLIAPMPAHMRAALAQQFAQLDLPDGRACDFADDSADAIASGTQGAALGLVERALRKAQQRLGALPTLLVTGGGAEFLAGLEHPRTVILPSLVIDGMALYVRDAEH